MTNSEPTTQQGHILPGELHPATYSAISYLRSLDLGELSIAMEAFASCAIEGNELAEVCHETLRRLLYGESVSDRYILGLAWTLASSKEERG